MAEHSWLLNLDDAQTNVACGVRIAANLTAVCAQSHTPPALQTLLEVGWPVKLAAYMASSRLSNRLVGLLQTGVALNTYIRPFDGIVAPGPNGFPPKDSFTFPRLPKPQISARSIVDGPTCLRLKQITFATNEEIKLLP